MFSMFYPRFRCLLTAFARLFVLLAGLGCLHSAKALEAIDDKEMRGAIGEGIAFVPEKFSVQFGDTSYINIVPRGPADSGSNKADIYIYGLSIGANKTPSVPNTVDRYVSPVGSWGSVSNPFVLQVGSAIVPTLSTNADPTTGSNYKNQSYIRIAAPKLPDQTYNGSIPDIPLANGYGNLMHVGFWTDFIEKDNNGTQATASYWNNGMAYYSSMFRAQVIGDMFSINGSEVKLFATTSNYVYNISNGTYSTSSNTDSSSNSSYNNTFGATLLLRLNSRNNGVFRISTAQADGTVAGPLQASGSSVFAATAPKFTNTEGLFLRNMDINLPIGQLGYQPLIYDVAPDGRNFVLELARVPNNSVAYNALYNGSTCYQWSCTGATKGSVAIGDASYNTSLGVLEASKTGAGDGIKMVSPSGDIANLGNAVIDGITLHHLKIRTTGL